MTLDHFLPVAPNSLFQAREDVEQAVRRSTVRDDDMTDEVNPQLPFPPIAVIETESDYGDFASDEEEIIDQLLGNIAPSRPLSDAPLLVTDIEDYEEPTGVRLPKVLGIARSSDFGLPHAHFQKPDQTLCDIENPGGLEVRRNSPPRHPVAEEDQIDSAERDTRSPLERFRRPPKKVLSVTDLVSPAWCELQYFYTLSKHGRKKRTPAMKQGTRIHKALEDQVHTTIPVDISTMEDRWGLRIWNVIQGLRTLRDTGQTRELELWGVVGGEIVNGIVDELSYSCPDPKLEAQIDERYANLQEAKDALPEYQTTITDYLLLPVSGASQTNLDVSDPVETERQQMMPPPSVPGRQKEQLVYITDIKTRSVRTLPTGASIRPTIMQLHLYHHMVENLTHDNLPLQVLADRYNLDTNSTFSDSFIAQVGTLNHDFFETIVEQAGAMEDKVTASQIMSSQDSIDLLLRHNNLSSLWNFMIQQFQQTFLLRPNFSQRSTPSSTPQSMYDMPSPSTRLSPILTATYLSSKTAEILGSKSILFNTSLLKDYLEENLSWWKGTRAARGVELQEAWKCRSCDFRDDCSWIHERDAAAVAEADTRKKMREIAGVELKASKSEV